MTLVTLTEYLWGPRAKARYLFIVAFILLFTLLGARELWTQEHRWADIVSGMFYRHDFLHPYLGEVRYYDKPLLSYWLMAGVAWLTGELTTWALRLPSAFAGLLAVWSIYRLGTQLKDRSLGFLSGWMLLTTFYFLFWARTSSADMLNLAGILFAIAWYIDRQAAAGFRDYLIFFVILALTSLCKGLGGAIVPLLVVGVDMVLKHSWSRHLRPPLILAAIPALILYLLPFWASSHFGGAQYGESGLYLVYRENILRYFQPFDHQGPIYTYLVFLPVYLLPWTVFFIPALIALPGRWKLMNVNSRWIAWTLLVVFLFFTLSGSRRSYYVLPLVPFAVLMTAEWLLSQPLMSARRQCWAAGLALFSSLFLFVSVDLAPAWYYSRYGVRQFANTVMTEAGKIKPWQTWNVVMLDGDSKLNFYLKLPPSVKNDGIVGPREKQTRELLLKDFPILLRLPKNTIFITRKRYEPLIRSYFSDYQLITPSHIRNENAPVAFVPVSLN